MWYYPMSEDEEKKDADGDQIVIRARSENLESFAPTKSPPERKIVDGNWVSCLDATRCNTDARSI